VDENVSQMVTHKKLLNIPLSGLKPGCTLEVAVTRRDLGVPEEFRFVEHILSSTAPIVQSAVFVAGETDSVQFQSSAKIQPQRIEGGLHWVLDDPAVYQWEPFQVPYADFLPILWLNDRSAAWPVVGKDYLDAINDRFELSSAERELAQNLVKGATNHSQKISAISRHVQSDYNYRAIEFGRRSRVPQKPADFAHSRQGDCKDHALLLQQLLEAVGVRANLALVNTRSRVQKTMASLDQFDHMVVFVPSLRSQFIDCTDKGSDAVAAGLLGLEGRDVFVLDRKDPRFVSVATNASELSTIQSKRLDRLTNDADAIVSETVTFHGPHAAFLRNYLRGMQPTLRRRFIEQQMNARGAEIRDIDIQNSEDTARPIVIQVNYEIRKQFELLNGQLLGRLPSYWERRYLVPEPVNRRTTPFLINAPVKFESTVELAVPDRFRVPSPESFDQAFALTWGSSVTKGERQPGAVKINSVIEQRHGKYSPAQYASFCETMERALNALERNIIFLPN
jgi:hypothetical protein